MFQSIRYISYEGCRDGLYHDRYKIVDDDFSSEEWIGSCPARATPMGSGADAVINCYQAKNSSNEEIAHQLYRMFKYYAEMYGWLIEDHIKSCRKDIPQYDKYAELVEQIKQRYNKLILFW